MKLSAAPADLPTPSLTGLTWTQIPQEVRTQLARKLEGLYGHARDAEAFSTLLPDKQQALLIFFRRIEQLSLWPWVRRIENVYGQGGVGMNFCAWPGLRNALERHRVFTSRWAAHVGSSGGFRERGRNRAVLHFLYVDQVVRTEAHPGVLPTRRWSVHFDLYNPFASPLNLWRHWWFENYLELTPDWQTIDKELGKR